MMKHPLTYKEQKQLHHILFGAREYYENRIMCAESHLKLQKIRKHHPPGVVKEFKKGLIRDRRNLDNLNRLVSTKLHPDLSE